MRRIWLVGTAIAAFVAVPAIDMQAHAASFDSTQATSSGAATDDGWEEDALYLACGCGGEGGEGGEGGGSSSGGNTGGGNTGGGNTGGGNTGGGNTGGGGTEGGREGGTNDELPQ